MPQLPNLVRSEIRTAVARCDRRDARRHRRVRRRAGQRRRGDVSAADHGARTSGCLRCAAGRCVAICCMFVCLMVVVLLFVLADSFCMMCDAVDVGGASVSRVLSCRRRELVVEAKRVVSHHTGDVGRAN
jgi:hypothetical protein